MSITIFVSLFLVAFLASPCVCTSQIPEPLSTRDWSLLAPTTMSLGRRGTFLKAPQKSLNYTIVLFASGRTESRGLRFHHKIQVIKCFNHTTPLAMWGVGGWYSFSVIPKVVKRWQHLSLQSSVISSSDYSKVEMRERSRNCVVSQTWQDLDLLLHFHYLSCY